MTKETIRDLNKCPVCGMTLAFVKGMKPTGHVGLMAVHEDSIPEGVEVLLEVKNSYKKHCADRDMKRFHGQTKTIVEPEVVGVKPKIVMARPPIYASEILPDRKVVEVGGLNHNRFAMIGKVVSTLRDSLPESQLKAIRSDLMNHGKDLNTLAAVASRYAIIHENGLPFTMESEL